MKTKIDLEKVDIETLILKLLLRTFEKILLIPGMEVVSPGGSPDGIGDVELANHLHNEIGREIQNDLNQLRTEA